MKLYLDIIREAVYFFPLIAFLFTIPYMIFNYHKYGSVLGFRTLVVYSCILYLLCVYFLVILPLPSREEVAKMTGPRMQLIPFRFLYDIWKEADFSPEKPASILTFIYNPALFQVIFNILMLLPFGVYLRYYFRFSLKKTILASFLLSLFFELTQLSGLYFIYPRSYRLFDADDLMANTLGGALGYLASGPFLTLLPSRGKMDASSFEKGQNVTLTRRFTSLILDLIFLSFLEGLAAVILHLSNIRFSWTSMLLTFGYFAALPALFHGQTPGKHITRIRITAENGESPRWYQYFLRSGSLLFLWFFLPVVTTHFLTWLTDSGLMRAVGSLLFLLIYLLALGAFLLTSCIRASRQKPLFYEKISGTRVVSTIRPRKS